MAGAISRLWRMGDPSPTIEHSPGGGHDAPLVQARRAGENPRHFALALLLAAALMLGGAFCFNVLVDPYGTVGTGLVRSGLPRDPAVKVHLLKQLKTPPKLIILGSSRSMKVQPSYFSQTTGLPGFNAGARGATPIDAWAMSNFIHNRFPGTRMDYFWMLDVEGFQDDQVRSNLWDAPELAQYVPSSVRKNQQLKGLRDLFSWQATKDSFQLLRAWAGNGSTLTKRQRQRKVDEFAPDGYRNYDWNDALQANGSSLEKRIRVKMRGYARQYRGYNHLARRQCTYFEKTLAAMNSWGTEPVIAISPINPRLLAALRPLGADDRHRDLVRYLESLHARYRFTVLDMFSISSFGGTSDAFYDGVHMTLPNMHRMIDQALADAPDAFQ